MNEFHAETGRESDTEAGENSHLKRVLVVDDEPLARERLHKMIDAMAEYQWVGEAGDGVAALGLVKEYQADLVLLDIAMPGMSGIEAAQHFSAMDKPPAVIFCTAYGEYAIEAFNASAVGYLLKPVRPEALVEALAKAGKLNRAQLRGLESSGEAKATKTHISSRSHRGVELLEIARISHFVSEDKYVFAHHDGSTTILEKSLKALEEELDGLFIRIHRNALASIAHIEAIERGASGVRLRLRDTGEKPQISRRHIKELKDLMSSL